MEKIITEGQLKAIIKQVITEHYSDVINELIGKINSVLNKVGLVFGGGMDTLSSTEEYEISEKQTGKIVAFDQDEYNRLSQYYDSDSLVIADAKQNYAIQQVMPYIQKVWDWNGD